MAFPPEDPSRRDFLKFGSAIAALSLTHAGTADPSDGPQFSEERILPHSALNDLRNALAGTLIIPGDPGYRAISLPNNRVYQAVQPLGIAVCANDEDIALALKWCRKHGIPLVTRNGGHSYAGFSTTRGLMINTQALNTITYDEAREVVHLGAGANIAQASKALQQINRTLTHGRCLGVGMAAFLLGGGIGFNMRRFGVGSDLVTQTELVLADGQKVRANPSENASLFWALRGVGGGNLGINTSFNVSVFPADPLVVFKINWSDVSDQFLATLFSVLENAPRALGHQIYLRPEAVNSHPEAINAFMFGQFAGTMQAFLDLIAPINAVRSPSSSMMESLPYWEGQRRISDAGLPSYYRFRSRFINAAMPQAMIPVIRKHLRRWKHPGGNGYIKFYQTGGAVNDVLPDATAFMHRRSQWLAGISIDWKGSLNPQRVDMARQWQDHFYRAITRLAGGGAYQNFVDRSLKDWEQAYYGDNLERLRVIKQQVDPHHVFQFQQAIKT